jgi:hypothetical protein
MPYKDYEKQKQNARERYYKKKEQILEQVTKYYYANHEKKKQQKKEWAMRNKEKMREYRKTYDVLYKARKRDEEKARWTLHNAIRYGKVERVSVCSECEKGGLLHAHHGDYNKPLDVVWLCHQCHFKKHRKRGTDGKDIRIS